MIGFIKVQNHLYPSHQPSELGRLAEKQTLEVTSLNVSLGKVGKYLTSLKQRLFWVKNEHQNGQRLQKNVFLLKYYY